MAWLTYTAGWSASARPKPCGLHLIPGRGNDLAGTAPRQSLQEAAILMRQPQNVHISNHRMYACLTNMCEYGISKQRHCQNPQNPRASTHSRRSQSIIKCLMYMRCEVEECTCHARKPPIPARPRVYPYPSV